MFDIQRLFSILLIFTLFSCSPKIVYVPIETNTSTKDSVEIRYVDSTIFHHQTVNKDYTGLLDTLRIQGEHSSMSAYADTSNFTIKGELKEEPFKERIVYKYKTEYRDSLIYKEIPVEVEKEKIVKVVPVFHKIFSTLGVLSLLALAIFIAVKLKI